jgi:predicted nucleotidyltransferase
MTLNSSIENSLNNQNIGLYKPIKWFFMITEKQIKIFEVFARKPFYEFTRKEVKKLSKEKSNNKLALLINLLKKENVLVEKKIGKSGLLLLNLEEDLTFYYIALCNNNLLPNNINHALNAIKKEIDDPFYSIVIFGSHAVGEQNKDSDLDIALFIDNKENQKIIEASANSAKLKSILELDLHVIQRSEMLEMLANKEENLGKQIARKHLAVYNHRIFYEILKEGIKHGFHV